MNTLFIFWYFLEGYPQCLSLSSQSSWMSHIERVSPTPSNSQHARQETNQGFSRNCNASWTYQQCRHWQSSWWIDRSCASARTWDPSPSLAAGSCHFHPSRMRHDPSLTSSQGSQYLSTTESNRLVCEFLAWHLPNHHRHRRWYQSLELFSTLHHFN